jgi:cell division transport system permease protein
MSVLYRLPYFASKTATAIRAAPGLSLVTAGTIAAVLSLLGAYIMAVQNLERLTLVWGRSAAITAYVADTQKPEQWLALTSVVAQQTAVAKAELVTPVQALERFRSRGPEAAALVSGVLADILPATIEVELKGGFTDLTQVEAVAMAIGKVPGIAEVDYGREEFDRLTALLSVLRAGGLGAGILIALATAFIVANTIRLTVYARKDEIMILRLVGATAWFIRVPYLLEGALWGLTGGLGGALLLWLCDSLLAERLSLAVADVLGGLQVNLFALDVAVMIIAGGTALGVLGSALAVRRFLDMEPM